MFQGARFQDLMLRVAGIESSGFKDPGTWGVQECRDEIF